MRSRVISAIRDADWLDAGRARAWRNILLAVTVVVVVAWVALSRSGLDAQGKPLGTDFLSFYAASSLALHGAPASAYDVSAHHAAQTAVFGRDVGYAGFFYPPLFLLICLPLAALPYLAALGAWLTLTGAAFLATARSWLDKRFHVSVILAFPALLIDAGHGQNAFLSAALLGSGAMALNRRPILAGVALGLVAFKPHLGLLLPIALIAERRWTTFASAAVTVILFALASLWVLGPEAWSGFFHGAGLARATLEQGFVEPGKMVSLFAAARVLGAPVPAAYAAQAAVAALVAGSFFWLRRRSPRSPAEAPLMVLAALLASPFVLDYDLVIAALPLAWLASEGVRTGFRPWEKIVLLAGFALPLLARPLATDLHIPIAPVVLLALFALTLKRGASAAQAETLYRDAPALAGAYSNSALT